MIIQFPFLVLSEPHEVILNVVYWVVFEIKGKIFSSSETLRFKKSRFNFFKSLGG